MSYTLRTKLLVLGIAVFIGGAAYAQKARPSILAIGGTLAAAGGTSEDGYKGGTFKVENQVNSGDDDGSGQNSEDVRRVPIMAGVLDFLQSQPFFVIFGVVALGMWLGRKKIRGIAFGSVVCIILVGLLTSIWAYNASGASLALPDVLKTIFFNLFIFAIGVKIGPQFFAGLERDGWHMVVIGMIVAVLAPVLTYGCGWLFEWPPGTVAGVLAGSNNSSATFGAASSAVQSDAFHPSASSSRDIVTATLSAAFALCYTVSQVQFVLLMKLLPKLARFNAPAEAHAFEGSMRAEHAAPLPGTVEASEVADASVAVRAYQVAANTLGGRTVSEIRGRAPRVSIETVRRGDRWLTPDATLKLEPGDEVVVAAPLGAQVRVREALGPEIPDAEARSRIPFTPLTSWSVDAMAPVARCRISWQGLVQASIPTPCSAPARSCRRAPGRNSRSVT